MKNLMLSFCLLSFVLTGCTDEPLSESVVGTWDLESIEISNCDDPSSNLPLTFVDDDGCLDIDDEILCNVSYIFAADLNGMLSLLDDGELDTDEFTYVVNEDANTVVVCDSPGDCDTAVVDGNTMTITTLDDDCQIVLSLIKD